MGFTTSVLSSFTLTTSLLYLTILHHRRTRQHQAALLNSQTLLLNSLVSPQLASDLAAIRDENFSGWGRRERIWPFSLYDFKDGSVMDLKTRDKVEESLAFADERGDEEENTEERKSIIKRIGGVEYTGLRRPLGERWKDAWNRELGAGYKWVFGGELRRKWEDARGEIVEKVKELGGAGRVEEKNG